MNVLHKVNEKYKGERFSEPFSSDSVFLIPQKNRFFICDFYLYSDLLFH